MFAPIWQVAHLNGVRTDIDEPGIGLIDYLPYSAPYEDLRAEAVAQRPGEPAAVSEVNRK